MPRDKFTEQDKSGQDRKVETDNRRDNRIPQPRTDKSEAERAPDLQSDKGRDERFKVRKDKDEDEVLRTDKGEYEVKKRFDDEGGGKRRPR